MHIPRQKQHTSLSENLWMEKWFNTLGGAAALPTLLSQGDWWRTGLSSRLAPVCQSIWSSVTQVFVYQLNQSSRLIAWLKDFSTCLKVSVFLSVSSTRLPVCLFRIYLSIWMSTCLCASVSEWLPIRLPLCFLTSQSPCLPDSLCHVCIRLSLYLSFHLQYLPSRLSLEKETHADMFCAVSVTKFHSAESLYDAVKTYFDRLKRINQMISHIIWKLSTNWLQMEGERERRKDI